ncbi:MAG: DoxX family membrane protein [Candidatus Peribacter sp.]|nr:DoxX family membrane protein [Candidatus Peribacter sp.]MBT4393480.1 DoxX family membrane protein [Candidatus Peribacter sp.]MBT4600839.1 DoxX family membrane protein [Candidatus Peribacter sp.]MBT5149486.1 DoxX family membrane protein [Candidatus Peribacter sp.]MBT5637315.1 DoxX family membrane protein [Candidatus Peribacter sp.]
MKMIQDIIKKWYKNEYTFGAEALRIAFGIMFLLVGVKKFRMGLTGFADNLVGGDGHLAQEIPSIALYIYGLALPIAEFVAGLVLLLNKHVKEAYFAIAVMYLTFIFGQQYDGNTSKVGTEYLPGLLTLSLAVFFTVKSGKGKSKK